MNKYILRNTFSIFITILLLASCSSKRFYSTINTTNPYTFKDDNGFFLQDGDSISIAYSFYGENAPITITVTNRMSTPMYIDWRKSGIIIDNTEIPFAQNEVVYNDNEQINFDIYLDNPRGISYVRPYSKLERQTMELTNLNFEKINDSLFEKQYTEADQNGANRILDCIKYTEADSPLYLQTFLEIYCEDDTEPFVFESDFYMSELIKGTKKLNPEAFVHKNGNLFYVDNEKERKQKNNKQGSSFNLGKITGTILTNITSWALEGTNSNK